MIRAVHIPDVSPSDLPPNSNFSLVAGNPLHFVIETVSDQYSSGDFEDIYGVEGYPDEPQYGLWNAILTCFFIDTVRHTPKLPGQSR